MKTRRILLFAVLVAFVLPGVAIGAVQKINAHKVDGFHAVGPGVSAKARGGKLVALNDRGIFPPKLLRKSQNSEELKGRAPSHYEDTRCEVGTSAEAFVPAEADGAVVGSSFIFSQGDGRGGGPQTQLSCEVGAVTVEHVRIGHYRLHFGDAAEGSCSAGSIGPELAGLVTPSSEKPVVATTSTGCAENPEGTSFVQEVFLWDGAQRPVDASFAYVLLTSLPLQAIP